PPATKRPAYHSPRRNPSVPRRPRRPSIHLEDIAHTAHGRDDLLVEAAIDRVAQTVYEDVDDVGAGLEAIVVHRGEDRRLRHDVAGVAHQDLEQGLLLRP